jgi:hypothetical protein
MLSLQNNKIYIS